MEEKYKIHGFYIISILVMIIIMLIAVEWSEVEGLIDYITFSLTLTSLILAVLAIVYSIISNTSFGKIIHNLNESSSNLKNTSQQIDESNKILMNEICLIPKAIEKVDDRVSSTKSLIEDLVNKNVTEGQSVSSLTENGISNEQIIKFLEASSYNGLISLLVVVYSYNTNTAFTYDEIHDDLEGIQPEKDYLFAYYIAARALGLFTTESDGKYRTIIATINQELLENTEAILEKKTKEIIPQILEIEGNQKSEEEIKKEYGKVLKSIKNYFGLQNAHS